MHTHAHIHTHIHTPVLTTPFVTPCSRLLNVHWYLDISIVNYESPAKMP